MVFILNHLFTLNERSLGKVIFYYYFKESFFQYVKKKTLLFRSCKLKHAICEFEYVYNFFEAFL